MQGNKEQEQEQGPVNEDNVTEASEEVMDFIEDLEVNSGLPVEETPTEGDSAPPEGEGDEEEKEREEEEEVQKEGDAPALNEADSLREQLATLSSILIQHGIDPSQVASPVEEPTNTPVPTEVAKPQPSAAPQLELKPLEITQEQFDGIFENPENLLNVLNQVRESAVEQVLRSVPTLAANIVNQQAVLNRMVQDFYSTNSDLTGVKPFVAVVANELAAKNPGWPVEQVFSEAAVEARKRLHMKQESKAPQVNPRKPALPGKKTATRAPAAPSLSSMERQLADLMDPNL